MYRSTGTALSAIVLTIAATGVASAGQEPELSPEQREALEAPARSGSEAIETPQEHTADAVNTNALWSNRTWYERGSALMGSTDTIEWTYDGSNVVNSTGYQTARWIWPNIARNAGITRIGEYAGQHSWRAVNVYGAGVPTPWGDVKVYETTYTHYGDVHGNGNWDWSG